QDAPCFPSFPLARRPYKQTSLRLVYTTKTGGCPNARWQIDYANSGRKLTRTLQPRSASAFDTHYLTTNCETDCLWPFSCNRYDVGCFPSALGCPLGRHTLHLMRIEPDPRPHRRGDRDLTQVLAFGCGGFGSHDGVHQRPEVFIKLVDLKGHFADGDVDTRLPVDA